MNSAFKGGCSTLSKLILQVWLLGLFLHFFGLPALRRFHDKNVIVVKSVRKSDRTPVPAISIAVKGVENGWRKEGIFQHIAKEHCKSANSVEELIICIEKLTYDLPDISLGVALGPAHGVGQKIEKPKWTEDYLHNYVGRIYTLELPIKLRASSLSHNSLRLGLKPNLSYDLYIHDPNNFYLTANPEPGFPYVRKGVDPKNLPYYYNFALTEVVELNVPEDPCNEDPDFNYKQCIKEYLAKRIGCRTKWDNNSYPLCASVDDFK